ncbi:MAG: YafY family protein [Zoogloea sp.]|uniref:helix-turn-helix transcriptional regulator n=1 Tax=Zoogloea sp. TaxID=49181 RepID=UPI0026266AB1|nr:YafY family protein [Zoogloea sp.]MDD2987456.1 YafY family protein [Zoogloea sp.]
MRRADRLFQIVLLLDRGRAVTARELAEALQVSERTIYRDVADLCQAGVPINGEAGVGYLLRPGYRLTPLMFDPEELVALSLGSRMVRSWADPALGHAAERALLRIESVLPRHLRQAPGRDTLLVPGFHVPDAMRNPMSLLRTGISEQHKLRISYTRADGASSDRIIQPVSLVFWGGTWTLGAWCELRGEFRSFRLDRIASVTPLTEHFDSTGMLARYLRAVQGESGEEAS